MRNSTSPCTAPVPEGRSCLEHVFEPDAVDREIVVDSAGG